MPKWIQENVLSVDIIGYHQFRTEAFHSSQFSNGLPTHPTHSNVWTVSMAWSCVEFGDDYKCLFGG